MGAIGDDAGHAPDAVLELLLGPYHEDTDHPWHRLERGEISLGEYAGDLTTRAVDAGMDVDFTRLAGLLGALEVHEEMVEAVRRLRSDGYRTALVTNNVREGSAQWRAMLPLDELFDVVVDSSDVGMRKPSPAIYEHALALLGDVEPARAVFLDDAPGNVEGARRAGLTAILVSDPATAIAELDKLLAGEIQHGGPART